MRVIATFPRLRLTFIRLMRAYVVFLWGSSFFFAMATGIETVKGKLISALIYLTAWAFFTTSALMYSELRDELAKMRFTAYWRFFSRYSPPLGGYAVLHVLTGLVFVMVDVLHGEYGAIAVALILKGVFEHVLHDVVEDLKGVSFLYDETLNGGLDRIALKDPFK
ncbi:hypothetical protein [Thermococcus sp.]|uniref:hypothetical protein n=1 Tax=Thermococcus sp. TaxID=35749 RepID=UPI0026397ABD|nr:hypothetical protein [Thermococcus sp.]